MRRARERGVRGGAGRAVRAFRHPRGALRPPHRDALPRNGRARLDIVIDAPKLWWPNGYGEQPLYDLTVRLRAHRSAKKIGLRTLERVNRTDRKGLSMSFRVNGVEIFCKGADWTPYDALPQRQSRDRLEKLLVSAVWANMNMLPRLGRRPVRERRLLLAVRPEGPPRLARHDVPLRLYPATPSFLSSVEREIRHQVKRLRDHPCIALWCGNNEDVGALTWFPESRQNRDRYIVDYDRLNEGVIGRVVDEWTHRHLLAQLARPAAAATTPTTGTTTARGDMHYWSVGTRGSLQRLLHGDAVLLLGVRLPVLSLDAHHPLLRDAGGFQRYLAAHGKHHQRHPGGNSAITEMFTRYFGVPEWRVTSR